MTNEGSISEMFNLDFIIKIKEYLEKKLDSERYEHTLGVSFTAAALAMKYGMDVYTAEIAGLLHDCGKQDSGKKLIEKCRKEKVELSEDTLMSPSVVHGKYGAYLARKQFGIEDPDIINSISYHTTGRPEMSMLEKIIFIADYIEPMRSEEELENLRYVRSEAFSDLDHTMAVILHDNLEYLRSQQDKYIHRDTLDAFDYYKRYL